MAEERYPIGTQSFEVLRHDRCVYVDKTQYVYDLVHSSSRTYFLSRPRRFGKSLFLSTLEAYFKGKKELFEGLAIYDLEKDWESFPVLHFDLSAAEATSIAGLKSNILTSLEIIAEEYDITLPTEKTIGDLFGYLIGKISRKTGKQVVILIDEYDKGIIEVLDNAEQLEQNQNLLRPFFAQIKAQNANIRFCFITGVARFRHYTLFSGFNNPNDISMEDKYASICGITMDELLANFPQGIKALADKMGVGSDEALQDLKFKYDGYRFTEEEVYVFNPFDLLNCFEKNKLDNYWIQSGTSKVFVTYLSKSKFDLNSLLDLWVTKEDMEGAFDNDRPIPLLFQTGYLTIKDCKKILYRLGLPNGEVRSSLVDQLMPKYMGIEKHDMNLKLIDLYDKLENGDVDGLMRELTELIAKVPYHEFDYENKEKTYHLIVYSLFLMMGFDVRSEIAMSGGRIDMVAAAKKYVYVMEFKLDGTAQEALDQIDSRGYALAWSTDGRQVFKIGIAFSSSTRTISQWESRTDLRISQENFTKHIKS